MSFLPVVLTFRRGPFFLPWPEQGQICVLNIRNIPKPDRSADLGGQLFELFTKMVAIVGIEPANWPNYANDEKRADMLNLDRGGYSLRGRSSFDLRRIGEVYAPFRVMSTSAILQSRVSP
jgi:hypothetical protein